MRIDFSKPGLLEAFVLTLTIGAVLLFVAWQIGSQPVSQEAHILQQEVEFLSDELVTLDRRMNRLEARNAVLERETDVLRQANRLLREEETSRQAEIDQQQSQLDFFRRLAGTGGSQSGLDVYHAEILRTESTRVYQFILTLTQNIRRASIINGRVRIDIEGTMEDRPITLYWSRVSDGDTPEPTFRFKYFQQIEGYLTLPEGFSPTRLRLTLEAANRRNPVQRSYDWDDLLSGNISPASAQSD